MFIHTSDIHIGAFAGTPIKGLTVDSFREIANFAIENGFRYLVIAGDLFEEPRIESYEAIINVLTILRELRDKGVKVICGLGSHDHTITRRDLMSVLEASGLVYVPKFVVEDSKLVLHPLDVGDYVFYALPGLRNNNELEYLLNGRVVFKHIENVNKPVVAIMHTSLEFEGFSPPEYSSRYGKIVLVKNIYDKIPISKIRYLALGHIHFPIPLMNEFRSKAAYPGAPVGRDVNDLRETVLLRKKFGVNRRFLIVDVNQDPPSVKSIWSNFNFNVEEFEIKFIDQKSFLTEVKSRINNLGREGYKALLINLTELPTGAQNEVTKVLVNLSREFNVFIHFRSLSEGSFEKIVLNLDLTSNLKDLEKEAVEKFVKKKAPGLDVNRFLELMDKLSGSYEGRKEDYYRDLFKEIEPLLKEVVEKRV